VSVIDGYLAELDRVLYGPRRVKADLLAEVRGGLIDAAEAHERAGLDPEAAERMAVANFGGADQRSRSGGAEQHNCSGGADQCSGVGGAADQRGYFGDVGLIAGDFQAELGYAQSRRTALLLSLVLMPQGVIWTLAGQFLHISYDEAGPAFMLLHRLMGWLGVASLTGSVLAVLAGGIGLRFPAVRARLAAATGIFALTVAGLFGVAGTALTLIGPAPVLGVAGLPRLVAILIVPLMAAAISGWRCLTSSRRPEVSSRVASARR
jgi:hypothetical protein